MSAWTLFKGVCMCVFACMHALTYACMCAGPHGGHHLGQWISWNGLGASWHGCWQLNSACVRAPALEVICKRIAVFIRVQFVGQIRRRQALRLGG